MRKQLSTDMRCWTTHIFKRCYKNHPPMTFKKSVEIIELLHINMIDHLLKTSRPIEIRKALGHLELIKMMPKRRIFISWGETRTKGKIIKKVNHGIDSGSFFIKFRLAAKNRYGAYIFRPLKKHRLDTIFRTLKKQIT